MAEMEDTLNLMPHLAGAWDYAAATDVNWHPGRVERFYNEFYKGQNMINRYPKEMQTAVQNGGTYFLQAQPADAEVDGDMFQYSTPDDTEESN